MLHKDENQARTDSGILVENPVIHAEVNARHRFVRGRCLFQRVRLHLHTRVWCSSQRVLQQLAEAFVGWYEQDPDASLDYIEYKAEDRGIGMTSSAP